MPRSGMTQVPRSGMTQVPRPDNHARPKRLGSEQVIIKMLRLIFFLFFIKKYLNYP
jgi:hypothetical protein